MLAGALLLAQPAAAASLIATGAPGARLLELLECATGEPAGRTMLDAPLAAPPVLAADGSALYAATASSELLRLTVPALAPAARTTLAHRPAALAAGSGPDAILLVGGQGEEPLSAHDPLTLAELARYRHRDGKTATVSALMDNPGRSALVVGFGDLPETWEIVYDRAAPPVLLGFVHDYRNNEAVPLPGRLTARPFVVASPTRAFAPGPVPFELARIDDSGALGVINLEVRREIERPAVAPPGGRERIAAWRAPPTDARVADARPGDARTGDARTGEARTGEARTGEARTGEARTGDARTGERGWLAAAPGANALVPLRAVGWRPLPPIRIDGEVLALAPEPWGSRVLVAHRRQGSLLVSSVDPSDGAIARLAVLPGTPGEHAAPARDNRTGPAEGAAKGGAHPPRQGQAAGLRLVRGSDARCVALLDADGRWLGSVGAPGEDRTGETLSR